MAEKFSPEVSEVANSITPKMRGLDLLQKFLDLQNAVLVSEHPILEDRKRGMVVSVDQISWAAPTDIEEAVRIQQERRNLYFLLRKGLSMPLSSLKEGFKPPFDTFGMYVEHDAERDVHLTASRNLRSKLDGETNPLKRMSYASEIAFNVLRTQTALLPDQSEVPTEIAKSEQSGSAMAILDLIQDVMKKGGETVSPVELEVLEGTMMWLVSQERSTYSPRVIHHGGLVHLVYPDQSVLAPEISLNLRKNNAYVAFISSRVMERSVRALKEAGGYSSLNLSLTPNEEVLATEGRFGLVALGFTNLNEAVNDFFKSKIAGMVLASAS